MPKVSKAIKRRFAKGKASLDSMMEILKPFLPPLDLSQPRPANDWRLSARSAHDRNLTPTEASKLQEFPSAHTYCGS